jgi:hypothetical protein
MKRLLKDERGIAKALVVVLVVLGVILVGLVGTAAVILSNDLKITVTNQNCGTWDIAKGTAALSLNFLPGINVPATIAQGETAEVQVPRRFINSVSVSSSGSVELKAFGQSFSFGMSSIDLQRSTWDGAPLSSLVGQKVELSGDHTLVMVCR